MRYRHNEATIYPHIASMLLGFRMHNIWIQIFCIAPRCPRLHSLIKNLLKEYLTRR